MVGVVDTGGVVSGGVVVIEVVGTVVAGTDAVVEVVTDGEVVVAVMGGMVVVGREVAVDVFGVEHADTNITATNSKADDILRKPRNLILIPPSQMT